MIALALLQRVLVAEHEFVASAVFLLESLEVDVESISAAPAHPSLVVVQRLRDAIKHSSDLRCQIQELERSQSLSSSQPHVAGVRPSLTFSATSNAVGKFSESAGTSSAARQPPQPAQSPPESNCLPARTRIVHQQTGLPPRPAARPDQSRLPAANLPLASIARFSTVRKQWRSPVQKTASGRGSDAKEAPSIVRKAVWEHSAISAAVAQRPLCPTAGTAGCEGSAGVGSDSLRVCGGS
jgi:hypothetical protein